MNSERWLLVAAVALGLGVRVVAAAITGDHALTGDQPEYDATARLFAAGHSFWGLAPTGVPHPSVWKAPGYGAWVGLLYSLAGPRPMAVYLAQAVLGTATVPLVWMLGRRLWGTGVGLAAAFLVAVYPLGWQFGATLYPEAVAVPLTTLVVMVFLGRRPTPARAVGVGALVGLSLLVRPTSVFLLAGVAAAWLVAVGWRRGVAMTAASVAIAAVVVAPWTIRNYVVTGAFVPISVQDSAAFGTFNELSANDPAAPFAWRYLTPESRSILEERPRPGEVELRRRLNAIALSNLRDHPLWLPQALFWNGIVRFWDLRPPGQALAEAPFEGRDSSVEVLGLGMYYVLLPLAAVGLWRARRRREVIAPILALAAAATVVFTVAAATRYRAPLEPLIALLACSAFAGRLERVWASISTTGSPASAPTATAGR